MGFSSQPHSPRPARLLVRLGLVLGLAGALALLLGGLDYGWDWRLVWQYRVLYLHGLYSTIAVSAGAIVLGLAIGVAGGLARVSDSLVLREAATLYVEAFRGTPLLVQIYIFYFCVAGAAHVDNPFVIGMVTLAVFSGAYISEIVRAGIQSIDQGQWEAAEATGLSGFQTMRRVILPQAARRIVPPLAGQFVSLIKDSSLLSVISVRELTKASEMVNATTYRTFEAYLPLALLYLLLTYPLTALTYTLERR
jgi:polar amino acid transport system permease protein